MSLLRRSLMATKSLTTYTTTFTVKYEKRNSTNRIIANRNECYGIGFTLSVSTTDLNNLTLYATGLVDDITISIIIKKDGVQVYQYKEQHIVGESNSVYEDYALYDSEEIENASNFQSKPLENGLYTVEVTVISNGKIKLTSSDSSFVPDEYVYLIDLKTEDGKNVAVCKCLDSIQKTEPDPTIFPKGIKNEMTYFGG